MLKVKDEEDIDIDTNEDDKSYHHYPRKSAPSMTKVTGWALFSEEMAWFLYDFFKHKLNGFDKLIFYSYYINGFTMEEVGSCCCNSPQAIGKHVERINIKLRKVWKTRKDWRIIQDDCTRSDKSNRPRD